MKAAIIFILIPFFLISSLVHGQTKQGEWELSLSGYLGSIKYSFDHETEGEAQEYIVLYLRPGYYLSKEVEFEPEMIWTAQEDLPPALALSANIAYNFNIPNSKVTPFLLIGYGYANGIPLTQRLIGRSHSKLDISCFSAGAGLKIFLAESVALRTEYRYQSYNYESYYETTVTFHTLLLGFSFLL